MPRLKLLQVMLSTQEGGAENFFEKLTLAFSEQDIDQTLVIEPFPTRETRLAKAQSTNIHPIKFGGLHKLTSGKKLRHLIAEKEPDIILSWMNRASSKLPGDLSCPTIGRLGGYYKLKNYKHCSHLIGITPDLVDHITDNHWPESRVSLIPNFGETPKAEPASQTVRDELKISPEAKVLLSLGRLHEVKAHDVTLRALAEIPYVHLIIAGTGPLEADLKTLTESLGLSNRVHFLGWRRDTDRLFAAADICVFPSRYEPNGTVIMESWAHKTPLIASNAKGSQWLVQDGENGLLFEIDDIQHLKQKIQTLLLDDALQNRLIENGHATFEQSFSKQAVVDQYLSLFETLLTPTEDDHEHDHHH